MSPELQLLSATLDALPAQVCVVDAEGRIVAGNRSWVASGAGLPRSRPEGRGVGASYFEAWEEAGPGESGTAARATGTGVRDVLAGRVERFEIEYACHEDRRRRWFRLLCAPLRLPGASSVSPSTGAVILHVDVTEKTLAAEALRHSERQLRGIFERADEAILIVDDEGRIVDANPEASKVFGAPVGRLLATSILELHRDEDREREGARLAWLTGEGDGESSAEDPLTTRVRRADGSVRTVEWARRAHLTPGRHLVLARDITERLRLEEQLVHAQKMEAVGRLAGGIAHDFNNLLTAVQGYSELALRSLGSQDPARRDIAEILKASERAGALTRQLLAFSRRQVLEPRVVSLNDVIVDLSRMLRRLIGDRYELDLRCLPGLGHVRADQGQIQQVIMNLAVNARDAMREGGRITIETGNVTLGPSAGPRAARLPDGEYVSFTVADTGTGIPPEVRAHLFEPFFTTKELGKGTGLGLSTCYGIVKQSGGDIVVATEEGRGARFTVLLPRVPAPPGAGEVQAVAGPDPARGSGTVLVVEDEEVVRTLCREILERNGYRVISAANGLEALRAAEGAVSIDLVVTDVLMPHMSGYELARELLSARPGLRVLFMSGFRDELVEAGAPSRWFPEASFLEKPFGPEAFARSVRDALGEGRGETSR